MDQNKWLRILQEEQAPLYEGTNEHENADFYVENQNWLLGEIENYIKSKKERQESSIAPNEAEPQAALK